MSSAISSPNPVVVPPNPRSANPDLSSSIDDGSSALILRLQIQDINELLPKGGISTEADLSSWQLALIAQREDLERRLYLLINGQADLGPFAVQGKLFNVSRLLKYC